MNYQFIIGINPNGVDPEEALGVSCADALLVRRKGNLFLDFDREADCFTWAVRTAITDIEDAGVTVTAILGAEGGK